MEHDQKPGELYPTQLQRGTEKFCIQITEGVD